MLKTLPVGFAGGLRFDLPVAPAAAIETLPVPPQLILPLQQHQGEPGRVLVAVGEQVTAGQALSSADNPRALPIHAPCAATVTAIQAGAIHLQTQTTTNNKPQPNPSKALLHLRQTQLAQHLQQLGIAGLGGAGFPSFRKLGVPVHTLVINAMECEPYISCDAALLQESALEVLQGAQLLAESCEIQRCVLAIETNKPAAIAAIRRCMDKHPELRCELQLLASHYPGGSEKQLLQSLFGVEIPSGQHASALGILCLNVGSLQAIHAALSRNQALTSRIISLAWPAENIFRNYRVLLGTPIAWLLQQALGEAAAALSPEQLRIGGPLMGQTLHNLQQPLIKTSNCLLIDTRTPPKAQPCIRCGDCAQVCPVRLQPQQLYWHISSQHLTRAADLQLMDCIECGCCNQVCPSHIPLVAHYQQAKHTLRQQAAQRQAADQARDRYQRRQTRLAQSQQHSQRQGPAQSEQLSSDADARKAFVQAAIARAQQKRQDPSAS